MNAVRKVLVVDDDPVVGMSFNRVLSDKGYIVITAENGYDALMKLQEEKYDVVFTDIKMPGMDGLEVAERVKEGQPWTPVVIVTGYGTTANEERAKAAGVSDFLRKPLSPDMIEGSALKAMLQPMPAKPAEPEEVHALMPPAPEEAKKPNTLKNMALFLSAPFVGLVYAILLPFVGIGMLAWIAGQALLSHPKGKVVARAGKSIGKVLAVCFGGLAYALLLPFVGIVMLAWIGGKSLMTRTAK
jgi:CheY-like chemotaxis protein